MKHAMALALVFALVAGAFAAPAQDTAESGSTAKKKAAVKTSAPSVSDQLSDMKQAIDAQQKQIQQLMQQVQSRDAAIQQLQQQVGQAQSAAGAAAQKADAAASEAAAGGAASQQDFATMKTDVSDLKQNATNAALSLQETQKNIKDQLESPLAIHYKGVTITPGGFVAAETVWRSHGLGADINTPFNSIPFDGAAQSHMAEFFGSGRQSRMSMLFQGNLNSAKLTGYYESDFLSAAITSNNNQSDSYSLRLRQAWGQAALNSGWTFTGGQMWSLVTEDKKGVENRSEALPMTIDPQYTVGFSWARQYAFRITKNLGSKAWLAFAVEDGQDTIGGHGSTTNFLVGQQGASGGLYNPTANYSYNPTPDFVFKTAFEPGWGHFEVFGLVTDLRDRIYPLGAASPKPSALGAYNNSATAGGIGANARGTIAKHFDVGLHFLGGNGIGRYGTAGLSDAVARPDGVLVPVRNYQTLGTVEWHGPRLDVYANVGGEYESRTSFVSSSGKGVGYGSPLFNNSGCYTETPPAATTVTVATPITPTAPTGGTASIPVPGAVGTPLTNGFNPGGLSNCNGDTRNIIEGTLGFWYRFYNGPKGRVQWGPQYSYIVRNTWSGVGGNPSATENMFFTSFRYYLP